MTSPIQGVDDPVFTANGTFLSTTNPGAATDPTLTRVVSGTSPFQVTTVATAGQTGTNIVTGATSFVPSLFNTDSLKVAPNGDLVLVSAATVATEPDCQATEPTVEGRPLRPTWRPAHATRYLSPAARHPPQTAASR